MGTRDWMRKWLLEQHGLSYTKYTKLPTTDKLPIMREYMRRYAKA